MFEKNAELYSAILLLVLLLWETALPFFLFFKKKQKERLSHGIKNLSLGLLNAVMINIIYVSLWISAARFTSTNEIGIFNLFNIPNLLQAIIALLVLDCATYWWHRLNHKVPFLWRFHKVHHSDAKMDVTTAFRFHFGEIFISSALKIGMIFIFGFELWHLALHEALMFPVVQFHHSNIGLSKHWERILSWIIPTPNMHKIHHSRYQPETDSNFTSLLSVWDRIFGSYKNRSDPENISLGLTGFDSNEEQKLTSLLKAPIKKNY